MNPRARPIAVSLLAACLGVPLASQPAQQAQFRVTAEVVPVYVTASVGGLTRGDFVVLADGRERPIVAFSSEPQPFSAVVMLDYSGSLSLLKAQIVGAGEQFLLRLLPADRVRVGGFGYYVPAMANRIILGPPEFTGDQRELLSALRVQADLMGASASPVWAAVNRSLDALKEEPLRHVLILLSDGHDTPLTAAQLGADARAPGATGVVRFDDVSRRLRSEHVMVYSLGFSTRRLVSPGTGGRDSLMPAAAVVDTPPHPRMRELSAGSGGKYFDVTRDSNFASIFTEIADDLHGHYLIGFVPETLDGRQHRLEIKSRRSGVRIRGPERFIARP